MRCRQWLLVGVLAFWLLWMCEYAWLFHQQRPSGDRRRAHARVASPVRGSMPLTESSVIQTPTTPTPSAGPFAILHTTHGRITWELLPHDAPLTVANIIRMATTGVFNQSCFYRYERGFVLQGGLHCNKRPPHARGARNVPLEYHVPNHKYTVALARAGSDFKSGGSEFFINLADNSRGLGPSRKGGYAVFARVVGNESIAAMVTLKQLKTKKQGLTRFVDPQPMIEFIEISNGENH